MFLLLLEWLGIDFMMNYRKRKRIYFHSVVFLLNINYILGALNSTGRPYDEESPHITEDKYDLKTISSEISEQLKKTIYIELGITSMQKRYDTYRCTPFKHNDEKVMDNIAAILRSKLTKAFDILNDVKIGLEEHSKSSNIHSQNYIIPQIKSVFDNKDKEKDTFVSNVYGNDLSRLLTNQLSNATNVGFEQIYYLSTSDLRTNLFYQPNHANYEDIYLWKLYFTLTNTKRKNVIIGIDTSGDLNEKCLMNVQVLVKQIIEMLSNEDRAGIIASFESEWSSPYFYNDCQPQMATGDCVGHTQVGLLTERNKIVFNQFIDSLGFSLNVDTVNHLRIFEQFYKTIKNNFDLDNKEPIMFVYITTNSLNISYKETVDILKLIAIQEEDSNFPIVINTITVCDNEIIPGNQFLRDISEKKFRKYHLHHHCGAISSTGSLQVVNSTSEFGIAVARLFYALNTSVDLNHVPPGVSLPVWRTSTEDLIVSVYMSCGGLSPGLLALDVHFGYIAEDVTYFSNQPKYTYAYLLNMDGLVLMHPSFPRPIVTFEQPKFVDISYYEHSTNFTSVRNLLVNHTFGTKHITSADKVKIKYIWKRVLDLYIVCIVVKEGLKNRNNIQKQIFPDISSHYNLLYHRLDLLPPPSMCRHLNQMSTLEAGTIYLSASCFQSPYAYVRGSAGLTVSPLTLQSYMAYIKDNTRLLANPGLRDEVRNDVTISSHILKHFKRQHLQGTLYKYIVRRYVATMTGVLQMYPGSIVNVDVEPTRREWFVRAVEHPGKIVLTSPYLDAGGAGYIVTISHTIYEGNESGQHTQNDNIVAVMALDVTFGYIHKLLLETVPYCSKPNTAKCFIIDDRGYLVYHPNLLDPNGKGPVEQQHIIHKESLVANDLLNHKGFVQKFLCNYYADGTIQRYYKFNTLLNTVLSNVVHGEGCIKYYITAIPNTNAFIGIVNVTCNDVATFCPCSTVNRLCLICNRVEQNECECPCECPLNVNDTNNNNNNNPLCTAIAETRPYTAANMYYPYGSDPVVTMRNEKSCTPVVCEIHTTYASCVGVLGCEWCRIDVDAESRLSNPFCTSLTSCFHGILGSANPYRTRKSGYKYDDHGHHHHHHHHYYHDDDGSSSNSNSSSNHLDSMSSSSSSSESNSNELFASTYSSVGPAAGSIVALCFLLGLVFYCYRQYSIQFLERLYPITAVTCNGTSTSTSTQQMQMTNIEFNNEANDYDVNHEDQLLTSSDISPIISPYCITTEYRKPPVTGVDSDLGYSTMTPHDESERLSFALIELDSHIDDDPNASDSISTNTSVFGYPLQSDCHHHHHHNNTSMGAAIKTHCILAPVTVHRNMEAI